MTDRMRAVLMAGAFFTLGAAAEDVWEKWNRADRLVRSMEKLADEQGQLVRAIERQTEAIRACRK